MSREIQAGDYVEVTLKDNPVLYVIDEITENQINVHSLTTPSDKDSITFVDDKWKFGGVNENIRFLNPEVLDYQTNVELVIEDIGNLILTNSEYDQTIESIIKACANVRCKFSTHCDGRLDSAIKEKDYLDNLIKELPKEIPVDLPKARHWYDIKIGNIPINLKLTTGGTDNAFNKIAIIYTITGVELKSKNIDFSSWYKSLLKIPSKRIRDKQTEYHYLAVDKITGDILLKSIIDIHTYKSNPSNILQINWKNEFKHRDFRVEDSSYEDKIRKLLLTIQKSLKDKYDDVKQFVEADIQHWTFSG